MMRVAIIGAGPAGLESALYARALGHKPTVYEQGTAGESVARWTHVRLFTPWRMILSPLAQRELARRGGATLDLAACPSGRELMEQFLRPIAETLGPTVRTQTRVVGVSRAGLLKGEEIASAARARRPFRLLLERGGDRSWAEADVVIDASGSTQNPSPLGPGGLPAAGEERLGDQIDHGLPDILGRERARFARKRTLLVGGGHSAATNLLALVDLCRMEGAGSIHWIVRSERPYSPQTGDPLPGRRAVEERAAQLVAGRDALIETLCGAEVESISHDGTHFCALLRLPNDAARTIEVDRVVAATGSRPDLSITRELQVHHCYASEGPMALAAALLGGGASSDCVKVPPVGPQAHRNPEPGFFVAGQKSYGRSTNYLMANGLSGIRDFFRLIEGDPALDLYAT